MNLKINKSVTHTTYELVDEEVLEYLLLPIWAVGEATCLKCKRDIGRTEFPGPPGDSRLIVARTDRGVYEYHIDCWNDLKRGVQTDE